MYHVNHNDTYCMLLLKLPSIIINHSNDVQHWTTHQRFFLSSGLFLIPRQIDFLRCFQARLRSELREFAVGLSRGIYVGIEPLKPLKHEP